MNPARQGALPDWQDKLARTLALAGEDGVLVVVWTDEQAGVDAVLAALAALDSEWAEVTDPYGPGPRRRVYRCGLAGRAFESLNVGRDRIRVDRLQLVVVFDVRDRDAVLRATPDLRSWASLQVEILAPKAPSWSMRPPFEERERIRLEPWPIGDRPPPPRRLLGRAGELAELSRFVETAPVVWVTGDGVTSMVRQWLSALDWAGPVRWWDFDDQPLSRARPVVTEWFWHAVREWTKVGDDPASPRELAAALVDWLEASGGMLLVDGLESFESTGVFGRYGVGLCEFLMLMRTAGAGRCVMAGHMPYDAVERGEPRVRLGALAADDAAELGAALGAPDVVRADEPPTHAALRAAAARCHSSRVGELLGYLGGAVPEHALRTLIHDLAGGDVGLADLDVWLDTGLVTRNTLAGTLTPNRTLAGGAFTARAAGQIRALAIDLAWAYTAPAPSSSEGAGPTRGAAAYRLAMSGFPALSLAAHPPFVSGLTFDLVTPDAWHGAAEAVVRATSHRASLPTDPARPTAARSRVSAAALAESAPRAIELGRLSALEERIDDDIQRLSNERHTDEACVLETARMVVDWMRGRTGRASRRARVLLTAFGLAPLQSWPRVGAALAHVAQEHTKALLDAADEPLPLRAQASRVVFDVERGLRIPVDRDPFRRLADMEVYPFVLRADALYLASVGRLGAALDALDEALFIARGPGLLASVVDLLIARLEIAPNHPRAAEWRLEARRVARDIGYEAASRSLPRPGRRPG